jgi:hypothetical protein
VKSNQPSPVWPYLGILVCLFAIAVTAPRGWQSLARRESIQTFLDRHPVVVAEPQADASIKLDQPRASLTSEPTEASDASDSAPSRVPMLAVSLPQPLDEPDEDVPAEQSPAPEIEDESSPDDSALVDVPNVPTRPAGWLCVPRPEVLIAQLELLSSDPQAAAWTADATRLLDELCQADLRGQSHADARSSTMVLEDLRQIVRRGEALARISEVSESEAQLLRASYAISRRVEIWDAVSRLPEGAAAAPALSSAEEAALTQALARVNDLVRAGPNSAEWREYLLLDRLMELATPQDSEISGERRKVARQLLARLSTGRLSREQRSYVAAASLAQLQIQLRPWTVEALDLQALLDNLERQEGSELSADAQRLAEDRRQLAWSSDPAARQLGARIDEHYRNANIRLAVAGTFLNRLVPQPPLHEAPFRDTIVGADVTGRSTTRTRLEVVLVPDRNRLRLGLEAHGRVISNTAASSGPAVFYSTGESQFVVRKLFLCDARGLNIFPAQAEIEGTRSDLTGLETDFDGVPLVGSMVRNIARSQHEDLQGQARWETEQKVAMRARSQLDAEIAKAIDQMKTRLNTQVWETLARLDLELQPLALSTTEDRAVLRLRLAGDEQLGAYTPRPRAPSDSLMSLQVHESALNNALEKLQLEGRTFTLPELFAHFRQKLNRSDNADVDGELPEDIVVTFASTDAVRVHCHDGRVQVRIALEELREGKHRWHDFAVVTHYRPDSSTLDIHFVRDGTIFLEGESLRGKPQITLRTIFSKVLSAQRGWGLLSPEVTADPRLGDVTISQFTVDQGWIGLAYAQRPSVARKPK